MKTSPEPISEIHAALVRRMLSFRPGLQHLVSQLAGAEAEDTSRDGLFLRIHVSAPGGSPPGTQTINGSAKDSDGAPVDVILHIRGGRLEILEAFRLDALPLLTVPAAESIGATPG